MYRIPKRVSERGGQKLVQNDGLVEQSWRELSLISDICDELNLGSSCFVIIFSKKRKGM